MFALKDRDQDDAESHGDRLQKVLAAAGLGSRRACETLIQEGRVEVDREIVTELGTRVDRAPQEIRVDGEALPKPRLTYYIVHKPQGVVSTSKDPSGRPRVIDMLPPEAGRTFNVGRLDMSSEGLILLTNDGELANRLTHPRYGVQKTYHAYVAGEPGPEVLADLERGVYLAEGFAHVLSARVKGKRGKSTVLEMVLNEGRNREIRRLLARVGHKVVRLVRIAVGSLRLGELPPGAYRQLSREEVQGIRREAWKTEKQPYDDDAPLASGVKAADGEKPRSERSSSKPSTGPARLKRPVRRLSKRKPTGELRTSRRPPSRPEGQPEARPASRPPTAPRQRPAARPEGQPEVRPKAPPRVRADDVPLTLPTTPRSRVIIGETISESVAPARNKEQAPQPARDREQGSRPARDGEKSSRPPGKKGARFGSAVRKGAKKSGPGKRSGAKGTKKPRPGGPPPKGTKKKSRPPVEAGRAVTRTKRTKSGSGASRPAKGTGKGGPRKGASGKGGAGKKGRRP